jgi:hypothetical protein
VVKVKASVQTAVLRRYLEACVELYNISFFQWRYLFAGRNNFDEPMLRELLEQRIKSLTSRSKTIGALPAIDEGEESGRPGMSEELYESFENVLNSP